MPVPYPTAAKYQYVRKPVVVVVGMHGVEPPHDAVQPGLDGTILDRSVAGVTEKSDLVSKAPRRRYDIDVSVTIKIIGYASTRSPDDVEAERGSNVAEESDIVIVAKRRLGDQPPWRHTPRVLTQHHVRHVDQPARFQVTRLLLQDGVIGGGGCASRGVISVAEGSRDR